MNITVEQIQDKLKLLALAGFNTERGWDYAIPQPWADELTRMGIDSPARWFVADCTTGINPKLHHIGEAFPIILQHRSQAYSEQIMQLHESAHSPGASTGDIAQYNFIMHCPDNRICNEADAGFLDLNMVLYAFTEGWAQGRKSLVNEMKAAGDTAVGGKHIFESSKRENDGVTCAFRIVLRPWGDDCYVVHFWNLDDKGYHYGVYRNTKSDAMRAYLDKCLEYAVDPFPGGF